MVLSLYYGLLWKIAKRESVGEKGHLTNLPRVSRP